MVACEFVSQSVVGVAAVKVSRMLVSWVVSIPTANAAVLVVFVVVATANVGMPLLLLT